MLMETPTASKAAHITLHRTVSTTTALEILGTPFDQPSAAQTSLRGMCTMSAQALGLSWFALPGTNSAVDPFADLQTSQECLDV